MKKINVLFVSVLALGMTLASCSTDDSPSSTSGSVEGKWIYNKTAYTYLGVVNPEENYAGNELGCFKDYIELKAGGVYADGDYTGTGCLLIQNNGTWSKSGNIITVASSGLAAQYELVSVSSSELKVKRTDTQWGIISGTVIITFTKG